MDFYIATFKLEMPSIKSPILQITVFFCAATLLSDFRSLHNLIEKLFI